MKKILSLILILVICLSLCACGACNCGCCEKAAAEAAVVETVPEETQSQEEYLTELLVSEDWVDLCYNYYYSHDPSNTRYTFLHNGYGVFDYDGDHYNTVCFQWVLDGNKLLVMFEKHIDSSSSVINSDLYIFDNEQGVFTQKLYDPSINNYTEEIALIPASRIAEFK